MKKFQFIFIFLLIPLCPLKAANTKTIRITGSSTIAPIVSKALEKFQKHHPKEKFFVVPSGTEAGVAELEKKLADIAMVPVDIKDLKKNEALQNRYQVFTIGKDAVMPVVSFEQYVSGVTLISMDQLQKVLSGEIKNWKVLGGLNQAIVVVDPTQANTAIQFMISASSGSFSTLSTPWTTEKVRGLGISSKGNLPIYPSRENIVDESYPFARKLNLITNGAPVGTAKDFIDFLLSEEGQQIVRDLKFVSVR